MKSFIFSLTATLLAFAPLTTAAPVAQTWSVNGPAGGFAYSAPAPAPPPPATSWGRPAPAPAPAPQPPATSWGRPAPAPAPAPAPLLSSAGFGRPAPPPAPRQGEYTFSSSAGTFQSGTDGSWAVSAPKPGQGTGIAYTPSQPARGNGRGW